MIGRLIGFLLALLVIEVAAQSYNPDSGTIRVTLIGTGAPPPNPDRMGPATLVEAGDHKMLFDVGRGASINLVSYGLQLADVTEVFITHLHGDHVLGLPDFWLSGYHRGKFGTRKIPLKMYGPEGIGRMARGLKDAYGDVSRWWGVEQFNPDFDITEFSEEGVTLRDGDLEVLALKVAHSPGSGLDPYGYKITYKGRTVVISGDTGNSENLISHATGVDLLLHEIFIVSKNSERNFTPAFLERLRKSHTTAEVAGQVFNQTNPKLVVGYHFNNTTKEVTEVMSQFYNGSFIAGEDLMQFEIGDEIEIIRPD